MTRSFVIQMVLISVVGFLVSNQEFDFKASHLEPLAEAVHGSFLLFMRLILGKLSPEAFKSNFWARSLQQIVGSKAPRNSTVDSSGGSMDPSME